MSKLSLFTTRNRVSMSYQITSCLVSFTQYSCLPWILIFLKTRKYESWSTVTLFYGGLLSVMCVGSLAGQTAASKKPQMSFASYAALFCTLTLSYIGLAFVNRIGPIVGLFFMVGFSGGMLRSFALTVDGRLPLAFQRITSAPPHSTERNITVFIFSTLLTGFLYDNRTSTAFPCFNLALALAAACVVIAAYFLLLSRTVEKKQALASNPQKTAAAADGDLPASASAYTGQVPRNFLAACNGSLANAREMYGKTLAWRKKHRVDELHTIPQRSFGSVLKYYPHAIHGYSLDGYPVVYELLGKGNAKQLIATGISIDELVWHFNLRNEYIFKYLCAPEEVARMAASAPEGAITSTPFPLVVPPELAEHVTNAPVPRITTVIDANGVSMSALSTEVFQFIIASSAVIDAHYPLQVTRLIIINTPFGFGSVWGWLSKMLPASVNNKIDILHSVDDLKKYIHPSQRTAEFGGTDEKVIGQSPQHLGFLAIAQGWEQAAASAAAAGTAPAAVTAPIPKPAAVEGEGKPKKGVMGWIRNKFTVAPEAYLGTSNTMQFNPLTGKWELNADLHAASCDEGDVESGLPAVSMTKSTSHIGLDKGTSPRNTQSKGMRRSASTGFNADALEEHGLVLAIQAAHMAKKSKSSKYLPELDTEPAETIAVEEAPQGQVNQPTKISSTIFLIVLSIFVITSVLQVSVCTLLPVWLTSPLHAGGLGYGVCDLSLLLSCSGLVVLFAHSMLADKVDHLLTSSPIRALRIGAGMLLAILLILPRYMRTHTLPIEDILHHHHEDHTEHTIYFATFSLNAEMTEMLMRLVDLLPSITCTALILPSFLVGGMICCLYLVRKASSILLYLALSSTFNSPGTIRDALNCLVDALGPFLSALVASTLYSGHLKYPLDASFFLPLGACSILLAYMASLFLVVQFRGDFGVMTDYQELKALLWRLDRDHGHRASMKKKEGRLHQRGGSRDNNTYDEEMSVTSDMESEDCEPLHGEEDHVLTIPLGDLNLLFAGMPMGGPAYGSKLHNLKDDFKDV